MRLNNNLACIVMLYLWEYNSIKQRTVVKLDCSSVYTSFEALNSTIDTCVREFSKVLILEIILLAEYLFGPQYHMLTSHLQHAMERSLL